MISDSITQVRCEEDEHFYQVSCSLYESKDIKIKSIDLATISKIYYEHPVVTSNAQEVSVIVCTKSEEEALERAVHVFQEFFEKMAREVPEAIYQELDNREKWFYAKFTPEMKDLNLTCVKEVTVGYSPNLVFVDEVSGYTRYFTFVQAGDMDAAWEKAFRLFKDYTNTLQDILCYIDSKKK